MRKLFLLALGLFLFSNIQSAKAAAGVWCSLQNNFLSCSAAFNPSAAIADHNAQTLCNQNGGNCERKQLPADQACVALAHPLSTASKQTIATNVTEEETKKEALSACSQMYGESCRLVFSACDPASLSKPFQLKIGELLNRLNQVGTGVFFGIGVILALLIYAKRAAITNYIVHGNLPLKLPVYGEDIQCLFKRTQRVNWYGRTVFGIVANLAMTHQQLIDIRKYWLGRVIAFDSLRRQRQNQLATIHLQLAAQAKSDAHDRKSFWSRRWATLRSLTKKLFWVIITLFNVIMSLFFIRITVAKLARGTVIESRDLVLILQAKEAVEQSTTYLKEYLTTANTFDGGDEVYEPK